MGRFAEHRPLGCLSFVVFKVQSSKETIMATPKKGRNKTFASRRTMNPPEGNSTRRPGKGQNKAFQQHDADNRLGSFERAGGHARAGSRGHQ